jgi:hypothetical protein
MGMAQVVQGDLRDRDPRDDSVEGLAEHVRVDPRGVGLGEHQRLLADRPTGLELTGLAPLAEDLDGLSSMSIVRRPDPVFTSEMCIS